MSIVQFYNEGFCNLYENFECYFKSNWQELQNFKYDNVMNCMSIQLIFLLILFCVCIFVLVF